MCTLIAQRVRIIVHTHLIVINANAIRCLKPLLLLRVGNYNRSFFAYHVNSFLNIVIVYFFKGCQVKSEYTNQ